MQAAVLLQRLDVPVVMKRIVVDLKIGADAVADRLSIRQEV